MLQGVCAFVVCLFLKNFPNVILQLLKIPSVSKLVIANYFIAILIFNTAVKTINTIKKCTNRVYKTCFKTEIITSNNATKGLDDIGQLLT